MAKRIGKAIAAITASATLAAGALAVSAAVSAQAAGAFRDVPATYEFANSVEWMAAKGITTGWPDGTFRPHASVSRAAFAAFLYRTAGSPGYVAPTTSRFRDVPATHQFYKEISWAAQYGITTGWSDGTFRPEDPIKRDAIAAFMYRYTCSPAYSAPATSDFRDIAQGRQFYKEINWSRSAGLLGGWSDGTFRPMNDTERGAIAVMLHRWVTKGYKGAPQCGPAVTAQAPVFEDWAGSDRDTYTIPSVAGVSYYVNGVRTASGTYPVTGYDADGQAVVRVDASPESNRYLVGRVSWHTVFHNTQKVQQ